MWFHGQKKYRVENNDVTDYHQFTQFFIIRLYLYIFGITRIFI